MARAERQVPLVYFGRPGALNALPWPRGGIEKPYTRQVYDFTTGSGQHSISTLSGGARNYKLSWNALHIDNFSILERYWSGANGIGPWALIDPSIPNLLLPNQAGVTNANYDTSGWATTGGTAAEGTLSSNTTASFIHRTGSQRSMRWQFTVTAATTPQLLIASPYRGWSGIPVMTGLPYTWSLWVTPDGTVDTSITMAAKIRYFNAAGTQVDETTTADTVVTGWQKLTVTTSSVVSTAAYAIPLLSVTGATVITGGSVYLDEALFEQDSVGNSWAPGTGVRPVDITSLNDVVPFESRMRTDCDMTVQELAA